MTTTQTPPADGLLPMPPIPAECLGVQPHGVGEAIRQYTRSYALACLAARESADARDAARYRWLAPRLIAANFDWENSGRAALIFDWPRNVGIGGNCDKNIDAAMSASPESDLRRCEFCGCNTNAKLRACCDKGREADRAGASPESKGEQA